MASNADPVLAPRPPFGFLPRDEGGRGTREADGSSPKVIDGFKPVLIGFSGSPRSVETNPLVLREQGRHVTIRRLWGLILEHWKELFMFYRSKNLFFYMAAAAIFFMAGWACDKFANKSGISYSQVVAVVGDHNITFGDWMKQMDLLRVFASSVDPDNSEQVKAVLDSLIDQELVLDAAQKAKFSDPA